MEDYSEVQEIAEQIDKETADFNYKLILVGNKRVGKTSLTNRSVFEEFNENEASTRVV